MKNDEVNLIIFHWYARYDLNVRPQAPQACALSSWATGTHFGLAEGEGWLLRNAPPAPSLQFVASLQIGEGRIRTSKPNSNLM